MFSTCVLFLKPWQTPLNTQQGGGTQGTKRERGPKFESKEQNPEWVTKGH